MTHDGLVNLRDFIYLDVERVKSLMAQLDQGLLTDRSDSVGSSTTVEGNAGGSIPALLDIVGAGQYVSTDQATETRTLHDFVYNQTEALLMDRGRLKRLPEDFVSSRLLTSTGRAELSPVEYVLVRGSVSFSDYRYMDAMMENMNELLRITTTFSYSERLKEVSGKERASMVQRMNQEISQKKLEDKFVKDLRHMFQLFVKDPLLVRIFPFPENRNVRIVGPLQAGLLRDRLEDIRFKFGSAPRGLWTVFGQIASVPQANEERTTEVLSFSNNLDNAFHNMFHSLLEIEDNFRVTYPEIAITPIAIYRD